MKSDFWDSNDYYWEFIESLEKPITLSFQLFLEKISGKGEKERYTHLNAEFQIIASRDKKAFLSDQCK